MAITGTGTLTTLSSYVQRKALDVAKPNLPHEALGLQTPIPAKNSKTIKFRRYEKLSPTAGSTLGNIKILVEGATPTATQPQITDVTVTLSQYGNLLQWTDVASWVNEVDVDQSLMETNTNNMVETRDVIVRDGIIGGTNVMRNTDNVGGVSGAALANVAGVINQRMLDKVIRNLKGNLATYYKEIVGASTSIGTRGIRPSYVGIIHTDVEYDLEQVQGFQSISDYPSQSGLFPGEAGCYKNLRFVTSTLAKLTPDVGIAVATIAGMKSTTGVSNDVYSCLFMGKNAFAVASLASSTEVKYIPASQVDHYNPLGQWHSLSWKTMIASGILNQNWILRAEVLASA